jgi:hypothetical protein
MDSDRSESRDIENQMQNEAGRMERQLEELDEHVAEAAKLAKESRGATTLDDDEPLDAVAGDASERSTSSDDPTSAVGDPEDAST